MARTATVLSDNFKEVGEAALDERNRVSFTKTLEHLKSLVGKPEDTPRFKIYVNDAGQILLSPVVSVPMHEIWLYRNPEALRLVAKGLEEAREGKFIDAGSFEKYADDEID